MAVAKELREKRATIIMQAQALLSGSVTAEMDAQATAMLDEADALESRIKTIERADALAAALQARVSESAQRQGISADQATDNSIEARRLEGRLFRAYMTRDTNILTPGDKEILASQGRITAAGGVGTGAGGGYTVAPSMGAELLVRMAAYGGMREASRSFVTETGVDLPYATMDDTSSTATIVSENTARSAGTDLAFGLVTLKAWMYSTGPLPVSYELLQDTAFDFESMVMDAIALRFARGQNVHFTTGDGTTQPQGIAVGGAVGRTGATGQTTSVLVSDLIDLEHSVDPAYRVGSSFMMNDSTFKALKKLVDGQNRPLFIPGYDSRSVDTILGYPVIINQAVASMAASAKSIFFGNFKNYFIRDVTGLSIKRLEERYAESAQVAFIGLQRCDGRIASGGVPIKWYANSAS